MAESFGSTVYLQKPPAELFRGVKGDSEENSTLMLALLLCADEESLSEARRLIEDKGHNEVIQMLIEERDLELSPDVAESVNSAVSEEIATDGGAPHGE